MKYKDIDWDDINPPREDLVRRILWDALIGSRDLEMVPDIREGWLDRSRTFMDDKGDWT